MHLIHYGILRDMRLKIVAHYKEAPAAGLPQSRVVKLIFRKVILMQEQLYTEMYFYPGLSLVSQNVDFHNIILFVESYIRSLTRVNIAAHFGHYVPTGAFHGNIVLCLSVAF